MSRGSVFEEGESEKKNSINPTTYLKINWPMGLYMGLYIASLYIEKLNNTIVSEILTYKHKMYHFKKRGGGWGG